MTHYMRSDKFSNPTRATFCQRCNSTNLVGTFPDFVCLNCGNKFESIKTKKQKDLSFRDKPIRIKKNKKDKNSKYINSDCPTVCPKCQSEKIDKDNKLCKCKSCGYFNMVEFFEALD